jgi:hypothetical protein
MRMRICLKSIFWNQISSADPRVINEGHSHENSNRFREEMLSDASPVPQSHKFIFRDTYSLTML